MGDIAAANDDGTEISPKKDKLFDPSVDMLVNDFDDERTLEEEEALAAGESDDPNAELSSLQKESNMPLEELLALYGYRGENQENESPLEDDHEQSETMEELESEPDPPVHSSKLRALYEPIAENDQDASRLLRCKSAISRISEEEEEDYDYSPDEDEWRKTIMVGADYQAVIPEGLCHYDDALPYENEDKLLWDPSRLGSVPVEDYLRTANATNKPALPIGPQLRDDEQALFLLQQCGHSAEEALRRIRVSSAAAAAAATAAVAVAAQQQQQQPLPLMNNCLPPAANAAAAAAAALATSAAAPLATAAAAAATATPNPNTMSSSAGTCTAAPPLAPGAAAAGILASATGGGCLASAGGCHTTTVSAAATAASMSLWSEDECRNFESGVRCYGKNFYLIQQNKVRTRSVGELVQFYYLWKKSERHDIFANKSRLEKKKYTLHPGITDFMDRFLEEQDGGTGRDRSSSPNIQPNNNSNSIINNSSQQHHMNDKDGSNSTCITGINRQRLCESNAIMSPCSPSPIVVHMKEDA